MAKQDTQRLIEQKQKKGYVEIDASLLKIKRPRGAKPAGKKALADFEKSLGHRLPEEYRAFLLDTNGGALPQGFIHTPGVPGVDVVSVDRLFGLQATSQPTSLQAAITRHGPVLPKGHLPVAVGNDVFTLCLSGNHCGSVVFWNHESDALDERERFLASDGHVLAGSFDEFLTRIARFEEPVPDPPADKGKRKSGKPNWRRLFSMLDRDLFDEDATADRVAAEIEAQGGDLSGIKAGTFPFQNIANAAVLRTLLDAKLSPDTVDVQGQPFLWLAASSLACIALLLKAGANVEQRSKNDRETALMRAIFLESKEGVRKLLSVGANPTVRLHGGLTPVLKYNKAIAAMLDKAKSNWSR